ncbi:MAG TPA: hypothetical protein VHW65_09785 [Gemmatimonadales bacterium]|nr:hypothetical protein [Gemmatimonadales bacterium]
MSAKAQAVGGLRFGAAAVVSHAPISCDRSLRSGVDSMVRREHSGAWPGALLGGLIGAACGAVLYAVEHADHPSRARELFIGSTLGGAAIGYFIGY